MAAERRRAAGPDGRHHLELAEAQMPGVTAQVGVTVPVQDVRDLKAGPRHGGHALQAGGGALGRRCASGLSTARIVFSATRV